MVPEIREAHECHAIRDESVDDHANSRREMLHTMTDSDGLSSLTTLTKVQQPTIELLELYTRSMVAHTERLSGLGITPSEYLALMSGSMEALEILLREFMQRIED